MSFFCDFLTTLADAKIKFVFIGSISHEPLFFDLVLAMDDDNLEHFINISKSFKLRPVIPVDIDSLKNSISIESLYQTKGMNNFTLRGQGISAPAINMLIKPAINYAVLQQDAIPSVIAGRYIKVASSNHSMFMKFISCHVYSTTVH